MKRQQSMPSSTTIPLTILILGFLSVEIAANDQSCSYEFRRLANESNIANCKRLHTLGAEFGWKVWNYRPNESSNSTTVMEIVFGAKLQSPQGWIAWGVNPGEKAEMIGTKALIGIKQSDGSLKVDTYNVTKETREGCSLLPSRYIGLQVHNRSIKYNNEIDLYTIYARLVLPDEEYNMTKLNHVWQVGHEVGSDGQPLRHPITLENVDSSETIDLSTGSSMGQSRSFLRSVHGVLNIIGWGTLLPTGVIIARYFRVFPVAWDPTWFYVHIGCQLLGFLIGTVGWAIGLSLGRASKYYVLSTHRTFGIAIFTFATIQMLAFRLKPKVTDDYRKYWNMYHHFLGYGLLTIIFINIFKGISILQGGRGWKWAFIAILALLGTIVFGLEIYTWVRFVLQKKQHKDKLTQPKVPTK